MNRNFDRIKAEISELETPEEMAGYLMGISSLMSFSVCNHNTEKGRCDYKTCRGIDKVCCTIGLVKYLKDEADDNVSSNRERLVEMGYDDSTIFENPSYDDAIVGTTLEGNVIYDYDKMINHLVTQRGMTEVEAEEYMQCDTLRVLPYAKDPKPIILRNLE